MGSHTRNRRCGCDCRDDEHYDETIQGQSYSCCDVCDVDERPCRWVAKIDCSEITFAQCCRFSEGCTYTGREISTLLHLGPMPEEWCTWYFVLLSWYHVETDPCNDPIALWEWELDLAAKQVRKFVYDRSEAVIATAIWEKQSDWDCVNPNTVELIDDGGIEGLPKFICVVPDEGLQLDSCSEANLLETVIERSACYSDDADRCLCCDDCCECIGGTINLVCNGTTYTCRDQFCVGGRTGVDSPSGVSREMCCTFTIGSGAPVEICVVIYCSSGTWKADWYCDGTLDGTVDLASTCCPLGGSGNAPQLSCVDCSGCVSFGSADDCVPAECCDLTGQTFNVTVTPQAGCSCTTPATFTISETMTPGVWMGSGTVCGDAFDVSGLSCDNGTWSILGGVVALGCGFSDDATSDVDCPDLLVNFVATCGACVFDIEVSN